MGLASAGRMRVSSRLWQQNALHLIQLKIVVRMQDNGFVFFIQFGIGIRTFEVVTVGDFAIGDIDGVFERRHVHFGGDIKTGHSNQPKWQT